MSIVCILWFGAHSTEGVHVTVPSAHGTLPLPLLWLAAKPGAAMPTAATAAAPTTRGLLTFNVPPDGHGVAEGLLGDDAGARLSSPSVLQVLHTKFGHPTHPARKAKSRCPLCSTSCTWNRTNGPVPGAVCVGCRAKWGRARLGAGVSAGPTRRPRSAREAQACIPPRRCRLPADRSQLPGAPRTPLHERRR